METDSEIEVRLGENGFSRSYIKEGFITTSWDERRDSHIPNTSSNPVLQNLQVTGNGISYCDLLL